MLKTTLHESIGEVDPGCWDALGSDPLSTRAVLAAIEHARLPGIRTWYATIQDGRGRPIAAAPIARVEIDGKMLTHGLFRSLTTTLRRVHPDFLRTALMTCGTPLSVGNPPVRLARGTDAAPVLTELAGLLKEVGASEQAPWLAFKEFPASDLLVAEAVFEAGRTPWFVAPSEPNSTLRIRWTSFDHYLGSMRSHYRYKIRTAMRQLEREGVVVDVVPLADIYDDGLHSLYEAVLERAAVRLERLTPMFFVALGKALGDRAPLIRFHRDGRTIGWIAMLFAGDAAYDLFHGIDYEQSERCALYFNQLTAVVRLAIDRGARSLSLGQSTETAKARFGGESTPLWIALRHRNPAISRALKSGRRVLFPARTEPIRRVFRDDPSPA